MLFTKISQESQRLSQQIHSLNETLQQLPEGNLICSHYDNRCKWYQSDGHTKTYIPKKNKSLLEQLALKKYLTYTLEDLTNEKRALDYYLKHHHTDSNKAAKFLLQAPEYAQLLSSYFKPLSQELAEWTKAPYDHNPKYPEHLIHKTLSGQLVRSKSEAMIASLLFTNHIPFRYECALTLGLSTYYPDFTIRHPQTGNLFYWEHFGMMDDPSYCQNVSSKLQTYLANGIIPSIHLITTYETLEHPLCPDTIQKTIEHYFL